MSGGRAGPDGVVVVSGQRNGNTGLFLVQGGSVVEVASKGLALPGGLGTLSNYREVQTRTAASAICTDPTTRAWSVDLAGGATGTVVSGVSTESGNTYTGVELSDNSLFLVNNQNQVAAVREVHNAPATFRVREQLVVFSAPLAPRLYGPGHGDGHGRRVLAVARAGAGTGPARAAGCGRWRGGGL